MAFYETTSMRALRGIAPTLEERGENYIDVHDIGKRTTKFLEYQVCKAPLTNRNACKHTQDFVPLPLGDAAVNRSLAESFKGGFKSGPRGSIAPLDGRTMYEDTFPDLYGEQLKEQIRLCRQASAKPKAELTYTVCPPGDFVGGSSHEHEKFQWPNAACAKPTKVMLPKPGFGLGGTAAAAPLRPRTDYGREFGNDPMAATLRSLRASRSLSSIKADLAAQAGLVDPEYFQARRSPHISPGQ